MGNRGAVSVRGAVAAAVTLVMASALLLTGCADGDDAGGDEPVTLGSMLGVPAPGSVDYSAEQQLIEEAIAACMAREGWEYIPVQYPEFDMTAFLETFNEETRERLEREGLGIAYYRLFPDAGTWSEYDPYADWVNPNDAYVASLSEDEKAAYEDSLYGTEAEQAASTVTTTEFDPYSGGEFGTTGAHSGCSGESYDVVNGAEPEPPAEYWDGMKVHYYQIKARVSADPRTIALTEAWASCMRDAGYPFEDEAAFHDFIYTDIGGEATRILGSDFQPDPTEGWTQAEIDEFHATATAEEIDALYNPPKPELTADQRSQLEDLLEREVDLALANFECSKDMDRKAADIYADVEEQYVLEHADELTALAALVSSED